MTGDALMRVDEVRRSFETNIALVKNNVILCRADGGGSDADVTAQGGAF